MCLGKSVVVPAVKTYLLGCLAYLKVLVVLCGLHCTVWVALVFRHTNTGSSKYGVVGTNAIYP